VDPRIERALSALHAQPGTAPSIAALARAVNLSTSRFAHLFQEQVGAPPARYLQALRMIRARILIERTSLSIKEVMAQVGCNDPSHFTRDFRRFHGLPPREWRSAAARRRALDGVPDDVLDSASVTRVAALANERQNRPMKPVPRARAPDLTLHHTR
jgi:transcriptional regulator GlxA family with amidase domain